MSEYDNSYLVNTLDILTKTLVELSRISASPGERSHMIAYTTDFIKKQIRDVTKEIMRVEK